MFWSNPAEYDHPGTDAFQLAGPKCHSSGDCQIFPICYNPHIPSHLGDCYKKGSKSCLIVAIVLIVLLILCIAAVTVVDVFDPAIQLWEPYDDKYTLDLVEQAMGYDAILRGIARRDYVIGFYPFAYLPKTSPLTLEFNLRDKPAEQVLRQ